MLWLVALIPIAVAAFLAWEIIAIADHLEDISALLSDIRE
jgi:hypothetical protein